MAEDPGCACADDPKETALDAKAAPAPPRIRAKNCLRVVELLREGVMGLAGEAKSFIIASDNN
jgi:hypothetical protein